ncbi:MAG: WD40 repeat domain-containing protein, partial [Promethearchaeota archaeon]
MEKIDDEFLIQRLKGHDSLIKTLSFSPNAKYLVSGAFDGNIVIWEISNGNQIHKFKAHDSAVNAIVFTPDGKYIVSGSSDHTVKIWTFPSGK